MKKYLSMLFAAALIAAAPVYYAVSAQAEDKDKTTPPVIECDETYTDCPAQADSAGQESADQTTAEASTSEINQ